MGPISIANFWLNLSIITFSSFDFSWGVDTISRRFQGNDGERLSSLNFLVFSDAGELGASLDDAMSSTHKSVKTLTSVSKKSVSVNTESESHGTAERIKYDFGIQAGDNFYPTGISPNAAGDALFREVFIDNIQAKTACCQDSGKWYAVSGNHEYRYPGNPTYAMQQFQKQTPSTVHYPNLWYAQDFPGANGDHMLLSMLFLDTMALKPRFSPDSVVIDQARFIISKLKTIVCEVKPRFIVIIAHHPVTASGTHGSTEWLQWLRVLLILSSNCLHS